MGGPRTHVRGDIVASDPVEIGGTVEGDCRVSAHRFGRFSTLFYQAIVEPEE